MAKSSKSRQLDQYIVRFPAGMRDRIKKLAADSNRSMNAQIIYMLEYALDELYEASGLLPQDREHETPTDVLRNLIRRNIAVLRQLVGEYEDPDSVINQIAREDLEAYGVEKPDPKSTPANRRNRIKG